MSKCLIEYFMENCKLFYLENFILKKIIVRLIVWLKFFCLLIKVEYYFSLKWYIF